MLQNNEKSSWVELSKINFIQTMQTSAEKALNPNNYHLSREAKKRLGWLYILYFREKDNISKTSRHIGISRQWLSRLKQVFEQSNRNPRSLEPESMAPKETSSRLRIPEKTEELIIKIRDDSQNCWGKEKIARSLKRDYSIKINPNTVNNYLHKHKRISPKLSLKNIKSFENKKLMESENLFFEVKFRPPSCIKDLAPGALAEKDMKYVAKGKRAGGGKRKEDFWYQPH